MFDLPQLVLSLASFFLLQFGVRTPQPEHANKSVAIVGAGSAGLGVLRALVDLQDSNLDIVLYEQRRDVGGIWFPDTQPVHPPVLPETPLYPNLHTNIPLPSMSYPGFTYPPGTPLFPHHDYVEQYHRDFAMHYNLTPYIMLNHTVLSAAWIGSSEKGYWDVVVTDANGYEMRRTFDHLVVANGHYHYPRIPTFRGQEEWLQHGNGANCRRREILHSMFYRESQRYANRTVVVVGSGASGQDTASQIALYALKVYHSVHSEHYAATGPIEVKPEIAYFTPDAIVFVDGSRVYDVDAVILGTGYDLRIPFLEVTGAISVKPNARERDRGLTTNLRYLFPLHEHVFSLSASHPPNALAFIGLPALISSCPFGFAQGIYAANVIANASLLGSRETLLKALDASEVDLRMQGYDPYHIGHRMVQGSNFDYQDRLIGKLRELGAIPDDGTPFVEAWRREAFTYQCLKRGWERVEDLGLQRAWLEGVETEEEWADMMKRLNEWQEEWEMAQGLRIPKEMTLF